jgi:phosphoenolpyruvate synthase/pyruvate phosphate dikinase
MPDDIAEAIRRAYADLGAYAELGGCDVPVTVRSSASLWTGRAITYRLHQGIPS